MTRTTRTALQVIVAKLLVVTGVMLFWPVTAHAHQPGVMDQRDFPCQEDEVLGFDPAFGPDRVGCIHIEQLR
jgi:Gene product 79